MIYPSVNELSKNRYNRYMLCIATAKCARSVTDNYCRDKEEAIRTKDEKLLTKLISNTEKPVKTAINLLYNDTYRILLPGERPEPITASDGETLQSPAVLMSSDVISTDVLPNDTLPDDTLPDDTTPSEPSQNA